MCFSSNQLALNWEGDLRKEEGKKGEISSFNRVKRNHSQRKTNSEIKAGFFLDSLLRKGFKSLSRLLKMVSSYQELGYKRDECSRSSNHVMSWLKPWLPGSYLDPIVS